MFYKDIERDIKGVIKVGQDDEENMRQELEEYVVTSELADHFSSFYNSYQAGIDSLTDKMGVWVSGFFGSGKSHFIKILSYLLENREVNNQPAVEFFNDKHVNQKLLNKMKEAGQVPTDVVLFNIDSKSSSDSKANKDAIVKVFMKVFNEMQGFCGSIPWLAEMERKLVDNGFYEDFKAEFESKIGVKWEEKRQDAYFEADAIIDALTATTDMSHKAADNWFYNAEDDYSLSVEEFAQYVNQYIEEQDGDHHIVFLVDEIGQYIGDDTQLMLNLQTVVEDLGTYCGGKAWVLVTSQQDMDSITEVKGSDFSKIQGRFDTRLSLSSANVDEVIKKRILQKTESAKDSLELLYSENESILKNLITFSSDTAEMKNYSGTQDFAKVYPFIPYQFDLLQKVFEEVRLHGASGKHLSEGERSLLSAFQESAQKYVEDELGRIVPFSSFYDSIETFLDSTVSRVISKAYQNNNLTDQDVEVLKLLFMIRYIDEVPSNIENLTTLMISDIDQDKLALEKEIEESLHRLIAETLIQKNGPEYMFLTNEEQDVNKEIKNTTVDVNKIVKELGEMVFEDIYTNKKYRYLNYDFKFNKLVDDQVRGRQRYEIGVQVLTPYSKFAEKSEEELKLKTSNEDKIIIKLPNNSNLMSEVEQIIKIKNYLRKKGGTAKNESMKVILNAKGREVKERQDRVKELLRKDLKESDFYVKGERMNFQVSNPVEKINSSFERLIDIIYNKLHLIEEFVANQPELVKKLNSEHQQLNFDEEQANNLAIEEVITYIERQNERNLKVTMKKLENKFGSKPYGWKELDIAAVVIDLLKAQEINLLYNSENVDSKTNKIVNYLTKSRHKEKLIIRKRRKVEQRLINKARNLTREVFYESNLPSDEDGLMKAIQNRLINEKNAIRDLLMNYKSNLNNEYQQYPGKESLESGKELLKELIDIKDAFEFYNTLADKEEELLDYEDQVVRIKNFFDNQQEHYDKAKKTLKIYEQDKEYINNQELISAAEELQEILTMKEPYSRIHDIPNLRDKFQAGLADLLEQEAKPIAEKVISYRQTVFAELEEYDLEDEFSEKVKNEFESLLSELEHANDFTEIFSMEKKAERRKNKFLKRIDKRVKELIRKQEEQKEKDNDNENNDDTNPEIKDPTVTYKETVSVELNDIVQDNSVVETEEELEEITTKLKKELKRHLEAGKRIRFV